MVVYLGLQRASQELHQPLRACNICMCVCTYVCMHVLYVCMYVCMYVSIYICICMYTQGFRVQGLGFYGV